MNVATYSWPRLTSRFMSAKTARTLRHGTSSSSAIMRATEVMPPCPCSVCGTRISTPPSGSMASQALISVPSLGKTHGLGATTAAPAPGT